MAFERRLVTVQRKLLHFLKFKIANFAWTRSFSVLKIVSQIPRFIRVDCSLSEIFNRFIAIFFVLHDEILPAVIFRAVNGWPSNKILSDGSC